MKNKEEQTNKEMILLLAEAVTKLSGRIDKLYHNRGNENKRTDLYFHIEPSMEAPKMQQFGIELRGLLSEYGVMKAKIEYKG